MKPVPDKVIFGLRRSALGLILCSAATLVGCQHQDMAAKHHQARLDKLDRTVQVWGESEAERPAKFAAMLAHANWYFEHQADRFDTNLERAGAFIERDLARPEERLPAVLERAGRAIQGKPERIEPIAIELFF